ncbi:MAG: T9SS type A sorting domain-containing protein, partial [Ignavibacteria bacterium]
YGDYLRPTFSAFDKENNLVVVGYSYISNNYDFVTLKYSSEGNLLWSRYYNGGNLDRANSLFLDEKSNILIAGFTYINTYGDYLILEYNKYGDTLLLKNINGEDSGSTDEAFNIMSDIAGNIYVTGASQSSSFRMDYYTIKLDKHGQIIWSKRYRTPHENYAYCLNIDSSGNIYISGEGELTIGYTGIVSVKYSTITGILSKIINEFGTYDLYNYPNPFNPNTQINFIIPNDSFVRIFVYDISGRKLATLTEEYKKKGTYKIKFNSNKYSSGIYFYSLIINNAIVKTNRMLIIK